MKNFLNFSMCLLTFFCLTLFFYLRLTRKIHYLKFQSEIMPEYFTFFSYLFIISFSLFAFSCIFLLIKLYRQRQNKLDPSPVLLKFVLWYDKINIFYKTYGLLFDYIGPNYTYYLVQFARIFLNWSSKTINILIFLFVVLPRILVLSILLVEVYLGQLQYYFYSLLLLLIPLFFKFMVFILTDIGPRLLPEFKNFLEFGKQEIQEKPFETPEGPKKVFTISIRLKPEHRGEINLDKFMEFLYNPMLFIEPEMEVNVLPKYSRISTITVLIYLGVHSLIWGYILMQYFF